MKLTNTSYVMAALLILGMIITPFVIEFETVPPATKGKILTTTGYAEEVLEPGKYTLFGRQQLILLETDTKTFNEFVTIILSDKLSLTAEIRFRGKIAGTPEVVNSMFNDIKAGEDKKVSFDEVYEIYGKMIVTNKTREIISQYSVDEVHKNYGRLSTEIGAAIQVALKNTPLEIQDIALGVIKYPTVVTKAIEAAEERRLAISKEEAIAMVNMTKKKNELAMAEANYQIKITRAKAIRDANKILGENITPQLLELRRLEVMVAMANNKNTVFFPVESMTSPGLNVRQFSAR